MVEVSFRADRAGFEFVYLCIDCLQRFGIGRTKAASPGLFGDFLQQGSIIISGFADPDGIDLDPCRFGFGDGCFGRDAACIVIAVGDKDDRFLFGVTELQCTQRLYDRISYRGTLTGNADIGHLKQLAQRAQIVCQR